jgi:hypothetical protein
MCPPKAHPSRPSTTPPSRAPAAAASPDASKDSVKLLPGLWVVGGLARYTRDSDLYLIRGGLDSEARIRIQRWSDGATRTAYRKDVDVLSPSAAVVGFWETIRHENSRFALRSGYPNPRTTNLLDELKLFVLNSHHRNQAISYREEFIREFVILASWWHTHQEAYIEWHFVYTNIRIYCDMINVAAPGWTLVRRRLCQLEKLNNNRKARR